MVRRKRRYSVRRNDGDTIEETTSASFFLKMKNGPIPGSDGITVEFMRFCWPKIGKVVSNSFIVLFNKLELSIYTKNKVLSL